jgi:uncharacterized protein YjbI with pentapeptide repeats
MAILERLSLIGADLRKSNLAEEPLIAAKPNDTKLQGANLRGADLTNASGITRDQIGSAVLDATTKMLASLQR